MAWFFSHTDVQAIIWITIFLIPLMKKITSFLLVIFLQG